MEKNKKNMEQLISSTRDIELVLDNLKDGLIAHDLNRNILFFNKAAEKITGYSREDVLGRDCHQAFGAPFCGEKCSFCNQGSTPDIGEKNEYPITFITRSGEIRRIEMNVTAIMDGKVLKGIIATFADVTIRDELAIKAQKIRSFSGIIGQDREMLNIFQQIRDVAAYDYPVHIHGETGTGKERVAEAIHNESKRAGGPFVPVNCGAIPEGLVESELFGHVKGAFSGAIKDRKGRFELAHKGTLLLDEVAELPKQIQVKLLRFLQEGILERVGGEKSIKVDVRIISATNKKLMDEVGKECFRKDLYYRLNVIPMELPPLRKRKNDIPLLIDYFLERAHMDTNTAIPTFSKDAVNIMMDYSWPGNVRELQNVVQFAIVRCKTDEILPGDLPMELRNMPSPPLDLSRVNKKRFSGKLDLESVTHALKTTGGNKAKSARILGVGRATLYRFLDKNPEAVNVASKL